MKWQALSLALFASAGIASPITALPKTDIYNLRVSSKYAQQIDGEYLSVRSSQIGVFPGSPAVQVYAVPATDRPGRVELHKYPESDSPEVLAFVGNGGLLDFAVADPTQVSPGTTCDWKSFGLGSSQNAPGKPDNVITYAGGKSGNWVAFKGKDGWTINWRSADAITIESYLIVDIVYEPVGSQV